MSWPVSASSTRTASGSVKAAPSGGAGTVEVAVGVIVAGLDGADAVPEAVVELLEPVPLSGWPDVVLEQAARAATPSPIAVARNHTVVRIRRFDHAAPRRAPGSRRSRAVSLQL